MKVDKTKWGKKTLGEVCHLYQPQTIATNCLQPTGKYLVYGANGVIGRYNTYNHESPEVLITCRGATCGTINISKPFSWINGNAMVVHPKEENVFDFTFLGRVVSAIDYSKVITGAAQPQITVTNLRKILISIPPLCDQQIIVAELNSIQTMIDGYKALLADLDALAQSIFLDMFGDPITNPKGWEKKELRELGIISSGGTPLRSNPLYYKGDIDWYSAGELNHLYLNGSNEKITKEAIKESSAKLFKANSLFIGLYDTAAFKLGITLKEASANQACANLFPIKDNVIWIYYCLLNMKEYAWNFRKGIRQKNLSVGFIKSFSVPLPPLSLQQQFANQVEAIEKQKDLLREQLKDAETLMAERMQYYFS